MRSGKKAAYGLAVLLLASGCGGQPELRAAVGGAGAGGAAAVAGTGGAGPEASLAGSARVSPAAILGTPLPTPDGLSAASSEGTPPAPPTAAVPTAASAAAGAAAATAPAQGTVLDAPLLRQLPELPNGCEITSLAMLTAYLGLPYTKEELVERMPVDPTLPQYDAEGKLVVWGDPDRGFVGDVRGVGIGYSLSHRPLATLLGSLYVGGSLDLTGGEFSELERNVDRGRPVVVWTSEDFEPVQDWVDWSTPEGKRIQAAWNIHAVLLVGYDNRYVYFNNPLNGVKGQRAEKSGFVRAWEQFGRQAVTYDGEIDQ